VDATLSNASVARDVLPLIWRKYRHNSRHYRRWIDILPAHVSICTTHVLRCFTLIGCELTVHAF